MCGRIYRESISTETVSWSTYLSSMPWPDFNTWASFLLLEHCYLKVSISNVSAVKTERKYSRESTLHRLPLYKAPSLLCMPHGSKAPHDLDSNDTIDVDSMVMPCGSQEQAIRFQVAMPGKSTDCSRVSLCSRSLPDCVPSDTFRITLFTGSIQSVDKYTAIF